MADVHQLPDEAQVAREASEWMARLQADDVTAADGARFEEWRSAHPLHARAFNEVASAWNRFTAAGPLVRAVDFAESMNQTASPRPRASGDRWNRGRWAAAAAALAVLVGTAWVSNLLLDRSTSYRTAMGELATISLPDGSILELNGNSRARVKYTDRSRMVYLDRGEAFFTVTHNVGRPFWVVGGGAWTRAVGTAFDVDLRSPDVRVTVSAGTVKVGRIERLAEALSFDGSALTNAPVTGVLTAGQEADLRGRVTDIRNLSPTQLARSVGWREGTLYFENQPLSEVLEELSHYASVKVEVPDEQLRQLRVGGSFQANPQGAEALLRMLQQGFGLSVDREPGRVVIRRADNSAR